MDTPINILLVDDRPENLLALEGILADLGQNLVRASSGKEALKRLLEADYAVILLDAQMPVMDGFETAALIRQRPKTQDIPIIFLTAYNSDVAHMTTGYSVGAVDYLVKPIQPEILRAKVSTFVEIFKKSREIQRQANQLEEMNKTLKHQLEEVKWLNHELENVNQELESFSYSVSHDLRAPLRTINGFSQLLIESNADKLDTESKEFLGRIYGACNQMGQLIDDLLQLSRVTRSKLNAEIVELSVMVQSIANAYLEKTPERIVEFDIEEGIRAVGDRHLLQVVLDNLLGNAWKFSGHRDHTQIAFRTFTQDDGQIVYYVRDNGVGFDMAYQSQLFTPFQRLHSDTDFEGNGIGLATVQRIIRRHGGQIWAEGSPDGGATFYFTL